MSLLSITQTVAPKFGIPAPNAAASSTDQNIQQLVSFINEEGQELSSRADWQILRNESTFTTVAAETQGSVTTLAGSDFNFMVNETFWNRSQRRPVFGPKSPAQWQQLKAQFVQGPWIQYTIRGGNILFTPVPAAGQSCYFEWISKNWATDSTGVTGKTAMTQDTDIAVLDERLIALGAMWRFKRAKLLAYDEDQEKYEKAVLDAISRDGSKAILNLHGSDADVYPGTIVPAGNWTIP